MLNLAFDTTAGSCAVILTKDEKTLAKNVQKMDFGQAEALFPTIKDIFDAHNLQPANIDLITVCTGPGSFTGVRSSLAAARTLGFALPRAGLTGVSAFEAYVRDLADEELAFYNAVIIETKREDFYFQLYDASFHKITEPSADSRENIIPLLRDKKITLIGDGVERFLSKPSGLSLHTIRMDTGLSIEHLAWCGLNKFLSGRPDFPKPLYLRAPDVCLK